MASVASPAKTGVVLPHLAQARSVPVRSETASPVPPSSSLTNVPPRKVTVNFTSPPVDSGSNTTPPMMSSSLRNSQPLPQINLNMPALNAPPALAPMGINNIDKSHAPHPLLAHTLTVIAAEISNQLDNFLDTAVAPLIRSSLVLASTLTSADNSQVDPVLLAQTMTAARAMVLNCKSTISPWIRSQLQEQVAHVTSGKQYNNKMPNYGNILDGNVSGNSPSPATRHIRKRSTGTNPNVSATTSRRSSNSAPSPTPLMSTSSTDNLHNAISRPPSPAPTQAGDVQLKTMDKMVKTNDVDGLHLYIHNLMADMQSAAEGIQTETVDNMLFEALQKHETAPEVMMGQLLGPQGKSGTSLLHSAAAYKRANICNVLTLFGADPNMPNNRGVSPLMVAVEGGDMDTVKALVSAGAVMTTQEVKDLETRTGKAVDARVSACATGQPYQEQTPSSIPSTRRGSVAIAQGSTIHTDPKMAEYAKTVLQAVPATKPHDAGEKQVSRWLERIIKYGSKDNVVTFLDSLTAPEKVLYTGPLGHSKSTLLFTAAWNKRSDLFDLFITTYHVDPLHRNLRKHSALTMALEQNDYEGVELLMQYGCFSSEKEIKDLEGRTGKTVDARIVQMVQENAKVRKALSAFENPGASASKEKKSKPAVTNSQRENAFKNDVHKELERMVKFGQDPNKVRDYLENLSQAAREAHLGPNGPSKSTLLFTAAWQRRADMCKVLIECQADVNYRNIRKNAAISMAIEQGAIEVVNVLLEHGADASSYECKDIEKRTGKAVDDKIAEVIFDWCGK